MHRIAVSNVPAERAEDAGKWRIGSAGVAVCGGCMPTVRLNSNSPCGDEATHRWGCSHRTLVRARVRIEARHPPQTTSARPPGPKGEQLLRPDRQVTCQRRQG